MFVQDSPTQFSYLTRVYYDNTDAAGVVYHSDYLNFMERARTEWLLSLGFNRDVMESEDAFFAVFSAQLNFIYPARLHDSLKIISEIIKITGVSIEFKHIVKNTINNEITFCIGYIKIVCVDREIKLRRIPELLRRKIKNDG